MHCLCEIIAEVEFEENLHLKVAFLKLCLLFFCYFIARFSDRMFLCVK